MHNLSVVRVAKIITCPFVFAAAVMVTSSVASPQPKTHRLKTIDIECIDPDEDSPLGDYDELVIIVNPDGRNVKAIWARDAVKEGQIHQLGHSIQFKEFVVLELWERDLGEFPDAHDLLGRKRIPMSEFRKGIKTITMTDQKRKYIYNIRYRVVR